MSKTLTKKLVSGIKEWAKEEKEHNPSFSLVVGSKSFTIDQIVDHIEEGTEDGEMLMGMVVQGAVSLFTRYRK